MTAAWSLLKFATARTQRSGFRDHAEDVKFRLAQDGGAVVDVRQ